MKDVHIVEKQVNRTQESPASDQPPEFERVVKRLLDMPPKSHKKLQSEKTQGDDRRQPKKAST